MDNSLICSQIFCVGIRQTLAFKECTIIHVLRTFMLTVVCPSDDVIFRAFSDCAHFICNYLDCKEHLNFMQNKSYLTDDDVKQIQEEVDSANKVT